jgi:hypothetical protein
MAQQQPRDEPISLRQVTPNRSPRQAGTLATGEETSDGCHVNDRSSQSQRFRFGMSTTNARQDLAGPTDAGRETHAHNRNALYTIYGVWRNSLMHLFRFWDDFRSEPLIQKSLKNCSGIVSKRNRAVKIDALFVPSSQPRGRSLCFNLPSQESL